MKNLKIDWYLGIFPVCFKRCRVWVYAFYHKGKFMRGEWTCCGKHQLKATDRKVKAAVSIRHQPNKVATEVAHTTMTLLSGLTTSKDTRGAVLGKWMMAGNAGGRHKQTCIGTRSEDYVFFIIMVNLQACPTISIAWANPFPEIDVPTQENTIMGKISRHTYWSCDFSSRHSSSLTCFINSRVEGL